MLSTYKHIIWDWNGTILDDVDLGIDIINGLLLERNLKTITRKEYKKIFTIPVKDYYAKIGFDFEKEPFEIVGKYWIEEYEKKKFNSKLYDGIVDVLEKVKVLGIGQSILSAYSQHTLEEIVSHFGLTDYFTHIVGLDNIYAASKIQIGHNLMEKLGHSNGETLMIGDTEHDYDVATAIGADCILTASGHQDKKRLEKRGVKVLDNIKELFEL